MNRRKALALVAAGAIAGPHCAEAPRVALAPDSAPDWRNASAEARRSFCYLADDAGLVDPNDPTTRNVSRLEA